MNDKKYIKFYLEFFSKEITTWKNYTTWKYSIKISARELGVRV
jgi:hypothetical protein